MSPEDRKTTIAALRSAKQLLAGTEVEAARRFQGRKTKMLTNPDRKRLPPLYSTEATGPDDKMIYVKFFSPYGPGTWLAAEFDGKDLFFGAVNMGHGWSWGYFSLDELSNIPGPMNVQGVERDRYFDPQPFKTAKRA